MRDRMVAEVLAGFEPEVGAALWRLQECRERTLRMLATVPDEQVDRSVDGNTLGTILYHLALIEADWLYAEILEQPAPDDIAALLPAEDRDAAGVLSVVRGQGMEQHLARLATVRSTVTESLAGMSATDFHRIRSLPAYDVTPAWVLHHLVQHEAEHRGEMESVLSRMRV